jgi:hypothetical protein
MLPPGVLGARIRVHRFFEPLRQARVRGSPFHPREMKGASLLAVSVI